MTQSQCFPAPWGRTLKLITGGVVFLLAMSISFSFAVGVPASFRPALIAGPIAVVFAGMAFMVRGYEVGFGVVSVLRPGWRTRIPLHGLRSVEPGEGKLGGSLRLCGNGGFFSFTGLFWNQQLGRHRMFLNDLQRAVILRFPDRQVVLGPADPTVFVERIRQEAGLT